MAEKGPVVVAGEIQAPTGGTTDVNGPVIVAASGGTLGFYGHAPAAKPTVSGSRGSNAALASLLTALAGLGLLVDSSS